MIKNIHMPTMMTVIVIVIVLFILYKVVLKK